MKIMKWLVDVSHKYSKKPWLRFDTSGIDSKAGVKLDISWNPAFIGHLREAGFLGADEQDMIRQFLLSITLPPEVLDVGFEPVESGAHPELTSDLNHLKM